MGELIWVKISNAALAVLWNSLTANGVAPVPVLYSKDEDDKVLLIIFLVDRMRGFVFQPSELPSEAVLKNVVDAANAVLMTGITFNNQ